VTADDIGEPGLSFGPFKLLPGQRRLLREGCAMQVGSRASDLLVASVGQAGCVVSKAYLLAAAWPGTFVEETSLRVHIAALRKALGEGGAAPEGCFHPTRKDRA